ncbi:Cytochrome c oxidase assembly factor 1 [Vanrija pseudolonga]|uniref:Cytochrome c oxidase assembly factor 1 n=1 Tax=Vanrija pseudolonga TaxID=143232 RepID=A0AAF0YE91_9TREE|nr:Cytochrome c oxidase assembly factor 1 [Vanrija pseudolonga]
MLTRLPVLASRSLLATAARPTATTTSVWRLAPAAAATYATTTADADGSRPRHPPRPPVEPTTFDGKASPRDIHLRPNMRGLPKVPTPWEKERKLNGSATRPAPKATPEAPHEEVFNSPARPRAIYQRPRDLPILKNRIPLYLALAALGLGAWGLFILHATNNERLSSSVVRQISFQLRNSPEVANLLGDGVKFAPNLWGFGEPWIHGSINLMQGRIDLKFRVEGSQKQGTLFFTSIRPQQAASWQILRYKLITDDGEVLRIEDSVRPALSADEAAAVPAAA